MRQRELWVCARGAGADTMRRLAAPMIGGLASSFLLELLLYPVIFDYAKRVAMWRASGAGPRGHADSGAPAEVGS